MLSYLAGGAKLEADSTTTCALYRRLYTHPSQPTGQPAGLLNRTECKSKINTPSSRPKTQTIKRRPISFDLSLEGEGTRDPAPEPWSRTEQGITSTTTIDHAGLGKGRQVSTYFSVIG